MFLIGMAWAFGKASVFKYISDEYPDNIGVISGIVGLAGGLGGFILPIMFGVLVDLTGIRSSCFSPASMTRIHASDWKRYEPVASCIAPLRWNLHWTC